MDLRINEKVWKFLRPRKRPKGWTLNQAGECHRKRDGTGYIRVGAWLKDAYELEVIIHEVRHAQGWDLDEEAITRESRELATLLWVLGYRKSDPASRQ